MSTPRVWRATLIKKALAEIREFGFPNANEQNIITDAVYNRLFRSMLEGTVADLERTSKPQSVINTCRELIDQIDDANTER